MSKISKNNNQIKYCLANALVELIKEYPFDEITINEICNTAHVARATYYHYVNGKHGKENLLAYKVKNDYDEYIENHGKKIGDDILDYIYENKTLFTLLQKNGLSNVLISFLKYANKNNAMKTISPYLSAYVTFSYLGVIYQWIKDDFSKTPIEVATIIFNAYKEILTSPKTNQ